jgi:hypothetical protein
MSYLLIYVLATTAMPVAVYPTEEACDRGSIELMTRPAPRSEARCVPVPQGMPQVQHQTTMPARK